MADEAGPPAARLACAAVLAGGRSRRFGSDKALALFRGEPLLARTLRLLAPLCAELAVVAKDTAPYAEIARAHGATLLTDADACETPLAGLATALTWAPQLRIFVCAADMPFVADAALLQRLHGLLDHADVALARHGGALQTLAALWDAKACAEPARLLLAHGARGPLALIDQVTHAVAEWDDARGLPFLDGDTPDSLRALESLQP